jgi:hypothetical protein
MISKSWRRVVLSSLAMTLLLLPVASQAAPRVLRAETGTVSRIAEPAQWLTGLWEAVTGLWQTMTAGDQTHTNGPGDSGGTSDLNGDSGNTIDPDGNHG